MEFVVQFFGSLLGGGAAIAVATVWGRDWMLARLKQSIEREALIHRAAFELKRDTCLEALAVVDASFSQREWTQDGKVLPVVKQKLDISSARACHNKLALTCEDQKVLDHFMGALGMASPEHPSIPPTDSMIALRNAMRMELGFGHPLRLSCDHAWIGTLSGADAI